jgi:hypothetical protein
VLRSPFVYHVIREDRQHHVAIIVIGIFIGASLGALGVVLYGAAIITGALKLLEHLIIKEDQ